MSFATDKSSFNSSSSKLRSTTVAPSSIYGAYRPENPAGKRWVFQTAVECHPRQFYSEGEEVTRPRRDWPSISEKYDKSTATGGSLMSNKSAQVGGKCHVKAKDLTREEPEKDCHGALRSSKQDKVTGNDVHSNKGSKLDGGLTSEIHPQVSKMRRSKDVSKPVVNDGKKLKTRRRRWSLLSKRSKNDVVEEPSPERPDIPKHDAPARRASRWFRSSSRCVIEPRLEQPVDVNRFLLPPPKMRTRSRSSSPAHHVTLSQSPLHQESSDRGALSTTTAVTLQSTAEASTACSKSTELPTASAVNTKSTSISTAHLIAASQQTSRVTLKDCGIHVEDELGDDKVQVSETLARLNVDDPLLYSVKHASVTCPCGETISFDVEVAREGNNGDNCNTCYQRVRQDFIDLLTEYKQQGVEACYAVDVGELTDGYMREQQVICSCRERGFVEDHGDDGRELRKAIIAKIVPQSALKPCQCAMKKKYTGLKHSAEHFIHSQSALKPCQCGARNYPECKPRAEFVTHSQSALKPCQWAAKNYPMPQPPTAEYSTHSQSALKPCQWAAKNYPEPKPPTAEYSTHSQSALKPCQWAAKKCPEYKPPSEHSTHSQSTIKHCHWAAKTFPEPEPPEWKYLTHSQSALVSGRRKKCPEPKPPAEYSTHSQCTPKHGQWSAKKYPEPKPTPEGSSHSHYSHRGHPRKFPSSLNHSFHSSRPKTSPQNKQILLRGSVEESNIFRDLVHDPTSSSYTILDSTNVQPAFVSDRHHTNQHVPFTTHERCRTQSHFRDQYFHNRNTQNPENIVVSSEGEKHFEKPRVFRDDANTLCFVSNEVLREDKEEERKKKVARESQVATVEVAGSSKVESNIRPAERSGLSKMIQSNVTKMFHAPRSIKSAPTVKVTETDNGSIATITKDCCSLGLYDPETFNPNMKHMTDFKHARAQELASRKQAQSPQPSASRPASVATPSSPTSSHNDENWKEKSVAPHYGVTIVYEADKSSSGILSNNSLPLLNQGVFYDTHSDDKKGSGKAKMRDAGGFLVPVENPEVTRHSNGTVEEMRLQRLRKKKEEDEERHSRDGAECPSRLNSCVKEKKKKVSDKSSGELQLSLKSLMGVSHEIMSLVPDVAVKRLSSATRVSADSLKSPTSRVSFSSLYAEKVKKKNQSEPKKKLSKPSFILP